MTLEAPLQFDMFTGALVAPRTQPQKKRDEQQRPQQAEMFSQRDIAQFGIKAKPLIAITSWTRLALISEDPRSPGEKESDLQREVEEQTHQMFNQNNEVHEETAGSSIPFDRPMVDGLVLDFESAECYDTSV